MIVSLTHTHTPQLDNFIKALLIEGVLVNSKASNEYDPNSPSSLETRLFSYSNKLLLEVGCDVM